MIWRHDPLMTGKRIPSDLLIVMGLVLLQYFTNWIEKSFSFIPISKYFSIKCLKS